MLNKWTRNGMAMIAVLVAIGPAMANDPEVRGTEKAEAEIAAAASRISQMLTELGPQLPDRAQQAIGEALAASAAGFDAALQALTRSTDPRNGGRPATDAAEDTNAGAANAQDGQPDQVGLEHARATVAQAFAKSVETLEGLASEVSEQAIEAINSALSRVQSHRAAALDNLDRLIAGEPPSRPSSERPGRPERPDRPERPELPERPTIPDRPEIPVRPEVPEPPERP